MKKLYLSLLSIIYAFPIIAQTHNDYIEGGVTGGVDRAFNGMLLIFIIIVVLVVILFAAGGVLKFYYWLNPEAEKREKLRKEKEIQIAKDLLERWAEKQTHNKPKEKEHIEASKSVEIPIKVLPLDKNEEDPKEQIEKVKDKEHKVETKDELYEAPIQTVKPPFVIHPVELSITGRLVIVQFYSTNYITYETFPSSKTKYFKIITKVEADGIDITNTFLPQNKDGLLYLANGEILEDTLENLSTYTCKMNLIDKGELDYKGIHSYSVVESQHNPQILHHSEMIVYENRYFSLESGNLI